jgi:uncharacterized repeat protein (TIGR03803 family)
MLAGCGGGSGTPLSPSPAGVTTERTTLAYGVLYNFEGGAGDGAYPRAALINANRTLYGTTLFGGSGSCNSSGFSGCGTIFAITTSGKETVLHSFAGGSTDGANPLAGLLNVKGTLYGTTGYGGAYTHCASGGCGTVFKITTSGTETVLHSFGSLSGDGSNPYAGLINDKGTLDGTTEGGGIFACSGEGCGTEFSITTSGNETGGHDFDYKDGAYPLAGLINVKGTLYGTTRNGGTNGCASEGCGTVFSITPSTGSGEETVLHSFAGSKGDGEYPYAGLINVKGTLYGTTYLGGAKGDGTIFSITTAGKETVLHGFGGSGDGRYPIAGLINVKGTLYGTTENGGTGKCKQGCGTVFAITTTGKETVLHSFGGSGDGKYPQAALINVEGTLDGTTTEGGAHGFGTIFSLTP